MLRLLTAILLLSSLLTAAAENIYFEPFATRADTCVAIPLYRPALFDAVETRAALTSVRERSKATDYYGFRWQAGSSDSIVEVRLCPVLTAEGSVIERPAVEIIATLIHQGRQTELLAKQLTAGVAFGRQTNSLAIEFPRGKPIKILVGKDIIKEAATLPATLSAPEDITFICKGATRVDDLIYEYRKDPAPALVTEWTREALEERFNTSPRTHEGFWKYLDRNTNDKYARPGGYYHIGIVGDGHQGFDLIYIDGAATMTQNWKPGMLKGHLEPTVFENHYNLTWYDALMQPQTLECSATFTDDAILTLSFPLLKATVRMSRILPSTLTDK